MFACTWPQSTGYMVLAFRRCLKARDGFGVTERQTRMRHCKGLGTRLDRTARCCHTTRFRKNTESNVKHVRVQGI